MQDLSNIIDNLNHLNLPTAAVNTDFQSLFHFSAKLWSANSQSYILLREQNRNFWIFYSFVANWFQVFTDMYSSVDRTILLFP